MCTSHKKALQPPHPSEPQVGQFIGGLPCQRCIPIYPLRYAISNTPFDRETLPQLDTEDYPPLQGQLHYGLRALRANSYVYLFYFKGGRMWTQHYQVTEDARFAALWWTEKDHEDITPGVHARIDIAGATLYLPAPETSVSDTVWLQVSNTLLTHCMLWKIELDNQERRSLLATQVKPGAGPGQPHSLLSSQLSEQVPEFRSQPKLSPPLVPTMRWSMFPASDPLQWSESPYAPAAGFKIYVAMRLALRPGSSIQPLALVLQDPIGIVSELNNLAALTVHERAQFTSKNAHKLTSAQLINNYFQQKHPQEMTDTLAKQKSLVYWSQAQAFPKIYLTQLSLLDAPVEQMVDNVGSWLKYSSTLGVAFSCFDINVPKIGEDYENAIFNCIGALVHSTSGRQLFETLVEADPQESLYWHAVAQGNPTILEVIEKAGQLSKASVEAAGKLLDKFAATPTTNALLGMLQAVPPPKKADVLARQLRAILEIRFEATLLIHLISEGDFLRYAREFESHQALGPDLIKRWNRQSEVKFTQRGNTLKIELYEWVKVNETGYRIPDTSTLPSSSPAIAGKSFEGNPFIKQLERLREPGAALFTGVGGALALLGMSNAIRSGVKTEWSDASIATVLGAMSTLVGTGIEIGAAMSAAAYGATNNQKAAAAQRFAAKRSVALFGAGGAALGSIADFMKAMKAADDYNIVQSRWYLGAAAAGGVVAFATWAGGVAFAPTLLGGSVALSITPVGWALIALIFLGLAIFASFKGDASQHGPVEIWLVHSAWGKQKKRYTHQHELDAFYSLLYRPRISVEWNNYNRVSGELKINCILPTSMQGEIFNWSIRVFLGDYELLETPLHQISDIGRLNINYTLHYQKDRLTSNERDRGWIIRMHRDAKLHLEYLYQPYKDDDNFLIIQPGAPEPLIFEAATFLRDPIDKKLIAPVNPPL